MTQRPNDQSMHFTSVRNALADVYAIVEQLAALFVCDILETHHEMTATHVPDQRKAAQLLETLLKIGAYFSNVSTNVAALHDLDIREARAARDGVTGIGKSVGQPGVRIRTG